LAEQSVDIVLAQSVANTDDAVRLRRLAARVPGVSGLRQTSRLTGGFGASRVYLATVDAGSGARRPWILKVGPTEDLKAEHLGYLNAKSVVDPDHIVAAIHFVEDGDDALLVYDYASGDGPPPRDL